MNRGTWRWAWTIGAVLAASPLYAETGPVVSREDVVRISRAMAQGTEPSVFDAAQKADPADDPLYKAWFRIEGGPGIALGSDTERAFTPLVRVTGETPIPMFRLTIDKAPRLYFRAQFSKAPGEPVEPVAGAEDLLAYDTLDFRAGLKQRLFEPMRSGDQHITLALIGHGGFATRLSGDPEARDKGPSYWGFGFAIDVTPAGHYLQATVGPDQRLAGRYRPVIEVNAGLMVVDKSNFAALLVIDALLDVDVSYYFPSLEPARRNSYSAAVVARWDTKSSKPADNGSLVGSRASRRPVADLMGPQ